MQEEKLMKKIPHLAKGAILTTLLKRPASKSGLILPDSVQVSDIQQIVAIGPWVKELYGVGDYVKINLNRFCSPKSKTSLRDGSEFNETNVEYFIPVETFGGNDYLLIDQGDIVYWWDGEDKNK